METEDKSGYLIAFVLSYPPPHCLCLRGIYIKGGGIVLVFYCKKRHLFYGLLVAALLLVLIVFALLIEKNEVPVVSPIYIGDTGQKAVSLMVNVDWGEELIPRMLEIFREKQVKTTFFITGRFAAKFPDTVKNIAAEGHEIGNHGYSHPHADNIGLEENKNEILRTEKIFNELGIKSSKLFAPPYGEHKPHVLEAAESLGYRTIMWTVDTIDWQDPPPEKIIERVIKKADNGVLVLMHPKECTIKALATMIEELRKQEFNIKIVSELIQ